MTTTEIVRLTDDNPLKTLQRPDGTWSAREVQASGYVHSRWNNWNEAIQRGINLLKTFGLDVSAGQDDLHSTMKVIQQEMPNGGTKAVEVADYDLTPLGLFAACQQAQLPELDIWFVFAGMQAAGYGQPTQQQSVASVLAEHASQLANISFYPDGSVKWVQFKRPQLPAPPVRSLRQELESIIDADLTADAANDREDRNDYSRAPYQKLLVDKLRRWLQVGV